MDSFLNSLTGSLSENLFGGQDPFLFAQRQAAAFGQASASMDPQEGGNKGPPPASSKALRQLPTVTVAPEDLVDENNRACCICLEENHLKERVMRLPCAHIFHQGCIVDWLTKHCTCPVCRYELETEDAQYEKSRKARMKCRKPRIHAYELERMSIKELKDLAKQWKIRWPLRIRDKKDIIETFAKSNRIDIIAAPEPVEFALQDLRQMGVSKLRHSMEDAGVFFDRIDVVEKEDMVQIFCNSGRLVVKSDPPREEEVEEDVKPAASEFKPALRPRPSAPPEEQDEKRLPLRANGPIVETVSDDDDDYAGDPVVVEDGNATNMFEGFDQQHEFISPDRGVVEERQRARQSSLIDETPPGEDDTNAMKHDEIDVTVEAYALSDEDFFEHGSQKPLSTAEDQTADESSEPEYTVASEQMYVDNSSNGISPCTDNDEQMAADYTLFESYTILDLRSCAQTLDVDLSRCIERSEMVEKLVRARNGKRFSEQDFDQWSVSQLLAIASAVHADLSHCGDHTAMVRQLVLECETRPHVANYLTSLMPLAHLSVSQLRAVAREWRVSVSDCIEKEEMIHRLVTAATPATANI